MIRAGYFLVGDELTLSLSSFQVGRAAAWRRLVGGGACVSRQGQVTRGPLHQDPQTNPQTQERRTG